MFGDSGSVRRFAAMIAPMLVAALNRKLGLELSESTVAELIALAGGFILASNYKETALAKAKADGEAAAATVTTPSEAVAVLKGAP